MNYSTYCMECGSKMSMTAKKCGSCGADYYVSNDIQPPRHTIPTPWTPESNTYRNDASDHSNEIDFSKFISAAELEAIVGAKIQGVVQQDL